MAQMLDVGSTNGALSKIHGLTKNLKRMMIKDRFGIKPHVMSTKNTSRACPICYSKDRSWRAVAVEHSDGIVRMHHCSLCKGSGRIFN
jgi:formate dehydrogenase maturation protein FdhE